MSPVIKLTQEVAEFSREQIEDFLYFEADLLDNWQLDEWFALFDKNGIYEVPSAGEPDDVSSTSNLFYISDDYQRLGYRIARLKSKAAHSEWPRSKLMRMISNVRIGLRDGDGRAVTCKFACYRSKHHNTDVYVGHINYVIVKSGDGFKIRSKRVMLDLNSLRPHGRVSILL